MGRGIAGVAAGVAAWIVIATAGNLALRAAIPRYGEAAAALRAVEPGYSGQAPVAFTLGMLVAR